MIELASVSCETGNCFEERVMPVAGVRHHQRLHGDGIFFHQIGDTGIGVDDDLIRQTLLTVLIGLLGLNEFLPNDQCG